MTDMNQVCKNIFSNPIFAHHIVSETLYISTLSPVNTSLVVIVNDIDGQRESIFTWRNSRSCANSNRDLTHSSIT
jgi:hypothetical protein